MIKKKKIKKAKKKLITRKFLIIGWREWVTLPELGIDSIKAKIDTGARTSSLHATAIEEFYEDGTPYVRFKVFTQQNSRKKSVKCMAQMVDKRKVKDSGGKITIRPVIKTKICIGELEWDVEITLADRTQMGFRMLLGRAAVRGHLLVNPGNSFILGQSV